MGHRRYIRVEFYGEIRAERNVKEAEVVEEKKTENASEIVREGYGRDENG